MNNDPTLSPAANQPPTHSNQIGSGHERDIIQAPEPGDGASQPPSSSEVVLKRKAGLAKKLQFMTHLMRNLDMLVFAEICTLYYMECSFPRLLLRVIPHYFFLTPKSEDFLLLLPAHRPHVFAIFLPNFLCILLHSLLSLPRPGEATRGYLHGGVIVDFVGQKPPTSRLSFILLDVMVMAIQCLMLAVHQEREGLRKLVLPMRRNNTNDETIPPPPVTTQDHDAEERGVLRDDETAIDETNEVELRPMSDNRSDNRGDNQETAGLLEGGTSRRAAAADLMGFLRSGNAVLGNFHVVHAVRTASAEQQSSAESSLQSLGYTATLAAMAAERRARLQTQRRQ